MTQPPGWDPPAEEQPPGAPPYPGWSTEQPPPSWAAPGSAPGGAEGWGQGPAPGWGQGPAPGWGQGPAPGWGQGPAPGWGSGGWAEPPAPKPGVVPLRPLGVGELLDGAITTLRRNPAPMLGLSAVVAAFSQVLQVAAMLVFYRDLAALDQLTAATTQAQAFDLLAEALAGGLSALAVTALIGWLATVLLTGVLTVVVSQAVLGEHPTVAEAWQRARPQLPRLLGLTLLLGVVVLVPLAVGALPGALAAAAGAGGAGVAVLVVLGLAVAVPVSVWLYVRLALSTPALMLETSAAPTGPARRTSVAGAMRRSAALVRGSWWRVLGILLLTAVLAFLVQQVIAVPLALLTFVVDGLATTSGLPTALGLVLSGLGGIVGITITAPFTAGVVVLLYVDRRIRREGLDLELARAAGVATQGQPGAAPGAVPPGPA